MVPGKYYISILSVQPLVCIITLGKTDGEGVSMEQGLFLLGKIDLCWEEGQWARELREEEAT